MQAQMNRKTLLLIAEDLSDAVVDSQDALDALINAYLRANAIFTGTENDPDPSTIQLGVQAQALGIKTLCQWLEAVSTVTSLKYYNLAQEALGAMHRSLDAIGVVIPDTIKP